MEFRQLRYFLEIARRGAFQRAATSLGLTQPALSRQIALLERELGQRLLERGPRQTRLTGAGQIAAEYARRIEEEWRELAQALREEPGQLAGEYSISSGGTAAAYLLPALLKTIHRKHPGLRLRVQEGDALETREALLSGAVDLGILSDASSESDLVRSALRSDRIVPVAARNHPLLRRKRLKLEDLRNESFVLFHPASAIRRSVEKRLRSLRPGFVMQATMELRSVESVIQSVEAGLGLGFLSELSLTSRLGVLPLAELFVERSIYLCYRKNARPGLLRLAAALQEASAA
ncbi:MAG: LysR family transcriptional regulator [Leptospirales bacterium]|nr:LysR family transcriptional regulator [Leptospirales bacterium]